MFLKYRDENVTLGPSCPPFLPKSTFSRLNGIVFDSSNLKWGLQNQRPKSCNFVIRLRCILTTIDHD